MDHTDRIDLRHLGSGTEHLILGTPLWPTRWLLVWTWISQVPGTAGENPSLDRREAQSAGQIATLRVG